MLTGSSTRARLFRPRSRVGCALGRIVLGDSKGGTGMRSQRLAPLSGIVFVVLVVVGFIPVGGSTPDSSDSPQKITSFYVDHHNKEFVAVILVAIGTLFLAIFVASLRDRLRAGGSETW